MIYNFFFFIILTLILIELLIIFFISKYSKKIKWIITKKDEFPSIDNLKLNKFFNSSYDQYLGWDRKPNTSGKDSTSSFSIDKNGSRKLLLKFDKMKISTFGDSYTFCRQVNDNQTWQYFLSNELKIFVSNYGVGNYGLDQAILKYKKIAYKLNSENKFIIMGVVPETICRIQSYWKHYFEFGNTFAFKPMFTFNKNLILHNNIIKNKDDFNNFHLLKNKIIKIDRFYFERFKHNMFYFPFFLSFIRNLKKNFKIFKFIFFDFLSFNKKFNENLDDKIIPIVHKDNIDFSHTLYKEDTSKKILNELINYFFKICSKNNHLGKLIIIPQLYDLVKIEKERKNTYSEFYKELNNPNIIDLTSYFLNYKNYKKLYINDSYGGHLSEKGNRLVSEILKSNLIL